MDTMLATIGIVVKEPWAVDISYEMLNYTLYAVEEGGDGCGYIALKDNIGVTPGSDETVWRKAVQAGQSIYDLAVKYHHFVGTEEEFEAQYQAALQAALDAAASATAAEAQVEAAEALRVQAESSRESAETARVAAESARATAEASRETAESARASAESSRASAETGRATAETARQTAETTRQSNEEDREEAEGTRTQQFEALKADMQVAIGQADAAATAATEAAASAAQTESDIEAAEASRVTAEQGRVTAEQGRASAEQGRVSAESTRVTAETARETQAETDHARAGSDHTQAGTDHTQAAADHTRAESDHSSTVAAAGEALEAASSANTAAAAADAARQAIQGDLAAKADKDADAVVDNLASFDGGGNPVDSGIAASDVPFLNRALGKYDAIGQTVLSQAKSGKYVDVNGAEVAASGYGISAPIQLNFGDILLVPSASAVPADVSVISRVVTRTYAKVINYTYTYRQDYPELYDTATADYDPTLVYTAVYDTSGETPVLTGWTIGGQTLEELPATHEVTDSYYGPLFKQAVAAMPSTGYYIYLCPQAMEVVISGYTATVNGGTCLTVGLGIFKNIVSNFLARPGQDAVAQSLCDLYTLILGLAGRLENLGDVKAGTIDCENLPKVCGAPMVIEGVGAPSVVPHFVGQRYHDTTSGAQHLYEAFAVTGSTGDWVLIK